MSSQLRDLDCFKPYKRADGRVITSSVVKDTEKWYQTSLLIPHEAIRRDMIEVNHLLKHHVKSEEPWKLVTLFHWYNTRFVKIVHTHHDAEEHVFFPSLQKRVHIPEKTSADHKMLMRGLDEVAAIGKEFEKLGGDENNAEACAKVLPSLRSKWEEVTALMMPHLAEEEEQMVTFIKDAFTKEEVDAIVQSILKSDGLGGARILLPTIFESVHMWGTEENIKAFQHEVPFPIKLLLRYVWQGPYQRYHRGALNSMYSGAPRQVIKEKTGWFS